jgi:predicted Zn-dependent peptidase
MAVYFATEKKQLNKSISLVLRELKLLRETPLGRMQLHGLKEQLMGQLAMSEESNVNFMLMMAKSILDMNRVDKLDEIFESVQQITAKDLQNLANEMFEEDQMSLLTFVPE